MQRDTAGGPADAAGSFIIMVSPMNSVTERSCWGVARWAAALFLAGVGIVYLFGGFASVVSS